MTIKTGFFYSRILKYAFVFASLFIFYRGEAQIVTSVSGIIIDSITRKPLDKTTLVRLSDNRVFLTDNTGTFYITCTPNDAIRISYVGFKTLRLIVTNLPDSTYGAKKFVTIEMSRNVKGINGVIVSEERRPGNAADSAYYRQVLKPIDAGVGVDAGGVEINAISMLYSAFNKNEQDKRKLTEILQQQYVDDVLNYRLSRQKLLNLTGDKDFTIAILKSRCFPSDFFILNASDYELFNWARDCYDGYRKNGGH